MRREKEKKKWSSGLQKTLCGTLPSRVSGQLRAG